MSNQRYSPEFKDEAVRQVVDRGYSVAEVAERLGAAGAELYAPEANRFSGYSDASLCEKIFNIAMT